MPHSPQERQDKPGAGIDRTLIRRMLQLTPEERIRLLVEEVRNLEELDRVTKKPFGSVRGADVLVRP